MPSLEECKPSHGQVLSAPEIWRATSTEPLHKMLTQNWAKIPDNLVLIKQFSPI